MSEFQYKFYFPELFTEAGEEASTVPKENQKKETQGIGNPARK